MYNKYFGDPSVSETSPVADDEEIPNDICRAVEDEWEKHHNTQRNGESRLADESSLQNQSSSSIEPKKYVHKPRKGRAGYYLELRRDGKTYTISGLKTAVLTIEDANKVSVFLQATKLDDSDKAQDLGKFRKKWEEVRNEKGLSIEGKLKRIREKLKESGTILKSSEDDLF